MGKEYMFGLMVIWFLYKTPGDIIISLFYYEGDVYEGQFKDGKFNWYGIFKYKSGDVYGGEFKDNKKEGKVIYIFKIGNIYIEANLKIVNSKEKEYIYGKMVIIMMENGKIIKDMDQEND